MLKSNLKILGTTTVLILLITLTFHTDSAYVFLKNKFINYNNREYFESVINIAEKIDLKKKFLKWSNPLSDTNIVKINLNEEDFNELKNKNKKWISAKIFKNSLDYSCKIKLHGKSSIHRENNKFSLRVKQNKTNIYFEGKKEFNLIVAEDADPTIIFANKMAKNMGLISSYGRMIILYINEKKIGAYYLVERISKSYLKNEYSINNYSKLSQIDDWTRKENSSGTVHSSSFDLDVEHIKKSNQKNHPKALKMYKEMTSMLKSGNIEKLVSFFDIEYMGKFLALASVFNDVHFLVGDNLKYIYNHKTNLFYPIYRQESGSKPIIKNEDHFIMQNFNNLNLFLFNYSMPKYKDAQTLQLLKALLSNNKIRNVRDKYLYKIISNESKELNLMKKLYTQNTQVLYASNLSRREQYFREKNQMQVFKNICDFGKQYLNYTRIYASKNIDSKSINLIIDSYAQLKIVNITDPINEFFFNGIEFNKNLKQNNKNSSFVIKSNEIENLVFINNVTFDTIKKSAIFLNYSD